MLRTLRDRLSLFICLAGLAILIFLTGAVMGMTGSFPVPQIRQFMRGLERISEEAEGPWTIRIPTDRYTYDVTAHDAASDGLVMISGLNVDHKNMVRVIDREGEILHEWIPDWFEIWPDDGIFPEDRRPEGQPGTLIHGAVINRDGTLTMNFEGFSTLKLDACGEVLWRLPNQAHHAVTRNADGTYWVAADQEPGAPIREGALSFRPPVNNSTIQRISPDGEILEQHSMLDMLRDNDLLGLLHLSSLENTQSQVTGDLLHLNDVEEFPETMAEGALRHGDLMVSLRNINSVLVLDPETLEIRHRLTGEFLRHHDPDFISGDRILVYDNRNLQPMGDAESRDSRILEFDLAAGTRREVFRTPFRWFSHIMGKHQPLPNGNLMLTVSTQGQALEITPDGDLAWRWDNVITDEFSALVTEASVLPPEMDRAFFEGLALGCGP